MSIRLTLPGLPLPALPRLELRQAARLLALGVVVAMAALVLWSVGPGNVLGHLVGSARREASVFISLLGGAIALALLASAVALMRGKPAWSLAIAALPLLALFAMLVR